MPELGPQKEMIVCFSLGVDVPVNQIPAPVGAELRTIVQFDTEPREQQQKEIPPPLIDAVFSETTQFLRVALSPLSTSAPPSTEAWFLVKMQFMKQGAARFPHSTAPPLSAAPLVIVIASTTAVYLSATAFVEEPVASGAG